MALVNYSKIKDTLKALTGIDDLNEQEEALLKYAVNRRIRMAYEESRFWPGFVHEELRYAGYNNVIPYEEDGKNTIDTFIDIQSADPRTFGSTARRYDWVTRNDGAKVLNRADVDYLTSLYQVAHNTTSGSEVTDLSDSATSTAKAISFWFKGTGVTATDSGSTFINVLNANTTNGGSGDAYGGINLFTSGGAVGMRNLWYGGTGTSMNVFLDGILAGTETGTATPGIIVTPYFDDSWHFAIWSVPTEATFNDLGSIYYERDTSGDGITGATFEFDIADVRVYDTVIDAAKAAQLYSRPTEILYEPVWTSSAVQYWVSYKANLPGTRTYGDGNGEVVNVPLEWFEYAVHGAYADWLRGEGQTDKAIVEEQIANQHLERQLERIQHTQGSPYLWSRFSTHRSRQWR